VKIRKAIKTIRILSRAPAAAMAQRAGAEDRLALRSFDKTAVKSLKKLAKRCFDQLDARSEGASIAHAARVIVATGDPALMDPARALDHIADAAAIELATLAGDDTRTLWYALTIVRALADGIHAVRVEALQPQHLISTSAIR
jgi:hypothetical protein